MQAVIPMYQRIQHGFPNSNHRILREIHPFAGFTVNSGGCPHIRANKRKRALQHIGQCSFYTPGIQKTIASGIQCAYFSTRNARCQNAQLGEKRLRIHSEQQQCRHRNLSVPGNTSQFILLLHWQPCKIRTFISLPNQIRFQSFHIQTGKRSLFYGPDIISIFFSKGFIAINFIFRHGLVRIAYSEIGALQPALRRFKAGSFRHVHRRYFRRNENHVLLVIYREHWANYRRHLLAIFHYPFLKILGIVNSHL